MNVEVAQGPDKVIQVVEAGPVTVTTTLSVEEAKVMFNLPGNRSREAYEEAQRQQKLLLQAIGDDIARQLFGRKKRAAVFMPAQTATSPPPPAVEDPSNGRRPSNGRPALSFDED
tara:strand:+ start:4343 stop:4687 length:345 start_codon:yes stop_codon:yes gene_type:complete